MERPAWLGNVGALIALVVLLISILGLLGIVTPSPTVVFALFAGLAAARLV